MPIASFFDKPLREARRAAKIRLKEAQRLEKRARALDGAVRTVLAEARREVEGSLESDNVGRIKKATASLVSLVDTHLDVYRKPAWRESVESIGVAVLVALLLRSFVVEAFKIPSGSMIPTLSIGDQIFVNKYVYGLRVPFTSIRLIDLGSVARGEVIVFRFPGEPHDDYIKRVIAIEGDEVAVRRGVIYINGKAIDREPQGAMSYADRDEASGRWYTAEGLAFTETLDGRSYTVLRDANTPPGANDYEPTIVPPDHVFVMGDNRDHSYDSRKWGLLPKANILGRSLFVWFSWGREGFDASRLGTWIE